MVSLHTVKPSLVSMVALSNMVKVSPVNPVRLPMASSHMGSNLGGNSPGNTASKQAKGSTVSRNRANTANSSSTAKADTGRLGACPPDNLERAVLMRGTSRRFSRSVSRT
jgi:hypothetical protein